MTMDDAMPQDKGETGPMMPHDHVSVRDVAVL